MHATTNPTRGFTLVEIMVVVVIIGLLAALALPAFQRVQRASRVSRFVNDVRVASSALEHYATEKGTWPPDGNAGFPPEMAGYLTLAKWRTPPVIGGNWDWDYQRLGVTAGLSVENLTAPDDELEAIDLKIDDGNLSTGKFQKNGSDRVIWIMES